MRTLAAVEGWLIILTGLHEETQEDDIHDKFCDFGDTAWSKCPPLASARGRLPRLLRARLTALAGAALPGERQAHWAPCHSLGCSS